MFEKLLKPHVDFTSLILRLGLAAIFIVHGVFKIDQNFSLRPDLWTMAAQTTLGWTELICGVLLALGLLSRLAALVLIGLQGGAIWLITGKHALEGLTFAREGADYTRVGPEYNMVLIALCLGVILLGSGVASVDHCLLAWWRGRKAGTAKEGATPAVASAAAPR
jgi:uncharacterized membrane protein YphA (DoxX/SURF4 family)